MRFLGIGEEADLAGMYLGLLGRGHEVRMYVAIPEAHGIYAGMVERCADWRSELDWIREAGREGVIVFESASRGAEQDALRAQGYQVIGGSAYGDRLNPTAPSASRSLRDSDSAAPHATRSPTTGAIEFVRETRARYVVKSNGAGSLRTRNFVGQTHDGSDMIALLSTYRARSAHADRPDFVLMDHVAGVETGMRRLFRRPDFPRARLRRLGAQAILSRRPGRAHRRNGQRSSRYRGAEALFSSNVGAHRRPTLREAATADTST